MRVELHTPSGRPVSLQVLSAEVLAAEPYAETLLGTMRRAFALYRDWPLAFARARDGSYQPQFTYGEVWSRAVRLARALAGRLGPLRRDRPISLVVMTRNRPEWIMADLAVLQCGGVLVSLAPDEPTARVEQILERVRPACVICEPACAVRIEDLVSPPTLFVVCDEPSPKPPHVGFDQLVQEGASLPALPPASRSQDEPYSVLFTSGSLGPPKGAVRSAEQFLAAIENDGLGHSPRHLSFQPLSHLNERLTLPTMLIHGASIAFWDGEYSLLDELRAFEPTVVSSVPSLVEALYALHRRRLDRALAGAYECAGPRCPAAP